MPKLIKYTLFFLCIIFLTNCSEKISYSGKILNEEIKNISDLKNKNQVISKLGQPNYIDPINKKYYFFSEKKNIKNFFNQKITDRRMIVYELNDDETIKSFEEYNLEDQNDLEYVKSTTPNLLIKRGLIEKIFGGVGNNLPETTSE